MDSHTTKPLNICGREVIRLRALNGWSQMTLAMKCQLAGWDVSRDMIASIELRRRRVGDSELVKLARVLAVPIEELIPKSMRPPKR